MGLPTVVLQMQVQTFESFFDQRGSRPRSARTHTGSDSARSMERLDSARSLHRPRSTEYIQACTTGTPFEKFSENTSRADFGGTDFPGCHLTIDYSVRAKASSEKKFERQAVHQKARRQRLGQLTGSRALLQQEESAEPSSVHLKKSSRAAAGNRIWGESEAKSTALSTAPLAGCASNANGTTSRTIRNSHSEARGFDIITGHMR